jgi:hypothetical protein
MASRAAPLQSARKHLASRGTADPAALTFCWRPKPPHGARPAADGA